MQILCKFLEAKSAFLISITYFFRKFEEKKLSIYHKNMEKIAKKAKISLYLDIRRATVDDTYPLKIQVFYGRQKLFNTGTYVSIEDFDNSYNTPKPKGERLRELKVELSALEAKANEVVDTLKIFTFEKFEKMLFATKQSLTNVIDHYNSYIKELDKNEQTGTAISYSCSIKSIRQFIDSSRRNPIEVIPFDMITPEFLTGMKTGWSRRITAGQRLVSIYGIPVRYLIKR